MTETVVVVGAGIAGLATALALEKRDVRVVVLERDPQPPSIDPAEAFESWKRPGVPQFHHTHIFLSRVRTTLRDRHPEVLAELERVGIVSSSLDQVLPPGMDEKYPHTPADDDLLHLWGRRATFEYVLRGVVGRLPNVRFVHGARAENLVVEREGEHLRVRGVVVQRGGVAETIAGDVVVDASGVRSKMTEMLVEQGARVATETTPSPVTYYCRHFKQRDVASEPPRRGTGASLDYVVFGTFFAEGGTFSIAFACPDLEGELAHVIRRPQGFDDICRRIPLLEPWTSRSEPVSRVLGGGGLQNRWHRYASDGPLVLGFFPVGDSLVQTNPVYGRGTSQAFVQAEALADTLAESADAATRARSYHGRVRAALAPHFEFSLVADKAAHLRARLARGDALTPAERLTTYLYEEMFVPAVSKDPFVAREWLKAQQMRDVSPFLVRLVMVLRLVLFFVLRKLRGQRHVAPSYGPERTELLAALAASSPPESEPREDADAQSGNVAVGGA